MKNSITIDDDTATRISSMLNKTRNSRQFKLSIARVAGRLEYDS